MRDVQERVVRSKCRKERRQRFTRCVLCVVEQTVLENDAGIEVPAVVVSCRRCDNCANSYGTDGPSIRRCFVLLRETCPNPNEHNWYVDETSDDLDNWDTGRNAGYSTHCG